MISVGETRCMMCEWITKVQHTVRLNAPFCGFARQPACLRRRPPGALMADDVRHSALGRVRGDPDIALLDPVL